MDISVTFNSHHMGFLIETSSVTTFDRKGHPFNSHHMGFLIETQLVYSVSPSAPCFQFPSYGISHWNRWTRYVEPIMVVFQFPSYGISHWNDFKVSPKGRDRNLSIPIIWDFSLKHHQRIHEPIQGKSFNSHHMGFLIETQNAGL